MELCRYKSITEHMEVERHLSGVTFHLVEAESLLFLSHLVPFPNLADAPVSTSRVL